uniref:NPC1 like intracellular cholesterol transporter 1 n=1 Tax=Callorhinchus milii TaxID=7868 RepID=A0A4W3I1X9_CALMI
MAESIHILKTEVDGYLLGQGIKGVEVQISHDLIAWWNRLEGLNGLLLILCCCVTSATIHQNGYCSFYEDCGKNPEVSNGLLPARVPCLYNGPAKHLTNLQHLAKLRSVCPMLYTGDNTQACCSMKQLDSIEKSLSLSKPILSRCPSCVDNFINLHCQNTCSPNQSTFINVSRTINLNVSGAMEDVVLEFQCFYSKRFADGSYKSCENVRIPATGGFAIGAMCGKFGATLCNSQRWLDFQGDTGNGLAPLDIDFILIDNTSQVPAEIVPHDGKFWKCNEASSPTGKACSCQDCIDSCPQIEPPSLPPGPWRIGKVDALFVICALLFIFVLVCILALMTHASITSKKEKVKIPVLSPADIKCSDKLGLTTQQYLGNIFREWGTMIALYPWTVILISLVIVVILSAGMVKITLTTDPVELWSSPDSRARREKDFHDTNFSPFFRTNQMIITVQNRPSYQYKSVVFGEKTFNGILSKDILLEILDLQTRIQNIQVWSEKAQRNISIEDICYSPMKPDNPNRTDCTVNSLLQYFQNNRTRFEATANQTINGESGIVDWKDHFLYCVNSPLSFKDITELGLSCMADYGAPVFPFLAVGGYDGEEYTEAEALIVTFSLNNYARSDPKFEYVLLWEQEYLKIVQAYKKNMSRSFDFEFMAERSLEDEINRTTAEDLPIFAISYLVIFIYITLALGDYTSWKRILIDSKITLGLGGILVVILAVVSAMGFYAYLGVPSSLIILEVVPFLVLAIGADNIFIFVLEYQRDERKEDETREEQIGRVLGNVAPSMLLCSISESICFFLGALTKMPAVRTFALYAGLSVLLDFLLQISMFVALFSLDTRRQESNRFDICCCVQSKNKKKTKKSEGILMRFMRNIYAPFLLNSVVRIIVVMGTPVYFVTTAGYNFSSIAGMNGVCSSVGCDNNSLTQKIQYATDFPQQSFMAISASSWLDDFIDWLNPNSRCCRLHAFGPNKGEFCPATNAISCLIKCMPQSTTGIIRPTAEDFETYLPYYLADIPTLQCPKGGLAAYADAVNKDSNGVIVASRFMAYHSVLVDSQEYTASLKVVRELAANITASMRKVPGTDPNFEVFPYSITYVFYEQYLTVVNEGLFNICVCLIPTFLVCCLLLGMDLRSGFLNLVTIIMIIVDTVGVMTLWSIDYNAVSLINLVTAVGISVEFVSHLTRSFAISTEPTRVERAKDATATMGSAVFAGVAMTNLPGVIVLYFAKAQLIQIFFFRLNLVITLLGLVHGLIFLPVLLSYFGESLLLSARVMLTAVVYFLPGPGLNKAVLLQLQNEAEMQAENPTVNVYATIEYERPEREGNDYSNGLRVADNLAKLTKERNTEAVFTSF